MVAAIGVPDPILAVSEFAVRQPERGMTVDSGVAGAGLPHGRVEARAPIDHVPEASAREGPGVVTAEIGRLS